MPTRDFIYIGATDDPNVQLLINAQHIVFVEKVGTGCKIHLTGNNTIVMADIPMERMKKIITDYSSEHPAGFSV